MDNASGEEDLAGKAQHIWSMLEDMAQSDPAAYRKFIDKHIKEGQEFMKPPEPHMCVQTSFKKKNQEKGIILYINICEWQRVPAPKTDKDPIPITGGAMYNIEAGAQAIGIALNPKVLEECGREAGMREEQQLLINLCLDFVDKQYQVKTTRAYSVLPHKHSHKGNLHKLRSTLTSKTKDSDDVVESELEKAFGPAMKDSILQMTNMSDKPGADTPSFGEAPIRIQETVKGKQDIKLFPDEKPPKKGLIQELGQSSSGPSLPEPEYSVTEKEADETRPRRLVLRVRMPDITSVAECELDITKDELHLLVADRYDLSLSFQEEVDSDNATAKFSRKAGTLTVTLPTVKLSS